MKALIFEGKGKPLKLKEVSLPRPWPLQVLIRVQACGICRTDLHIIDGDLPLIRSPLILGHQIVGKVVALGEQVAGLAKGDKVGVPWLGWTCGRCHFCLIGRENLCERAKFTGYHLDGGLAEYATADHHFCFKVPEGYRSGSAAPLLCGGLIGYRAYKMTGGGLSLGLYGFGSAAHQIIQVAVSQDKRVFVFTKEGDQDGQGLARSLGAFWAGSSEEPSPEKLDAAIIFAPVGELVPKALTDVASGGIVVCAGIHMTEIPAFPYQTLQDEKIVRSVANLTRKDGREFFKLVSRVPVKTVVTTYRLEETNQALVDLRSGKLKGSGVVIISK